MKKFIRNFITRMYIYNAHIYIYICRVGVTIRVRVEGVNESLLTLDVITMQ